MAQNQGHTVKSFDDDLRQLRAMISEMGGLAEQQIIAAIDAIEAEVERFAVRIIALRAPMADDLREVIAALKDIYDPEIPVNIYDLGLIYGVDVSTDGDVAVTMTLTTPHCPVAETMPGEIEMRINGIHGVRDATVNVTWDPPWDSSKMSDEARLELGML